MNDVPLSLEDQIILMKKYVTFVKKVRIRRFLNYLGYYRASRYGKFLLSYTSKLGTKPNQDLLYEVYDLDRELRRLFFTYCKKAELQFKSNLSNGVSLKVNDSKFYLEDSFYTKSRSENDKNKRSRNIKNFPKFKKSVSDAEKNLRKNPNKFPDFSEYRNGGNKVIKKIPCWAAFAYFEFGIITNIYAYLRGDLRKSVLSYGYTRGNYGKEITKQVDTWLDAIRNLRNLCSHHNRLIGKTSSVVLKDSLDEDNIFISQTDLFSRIYALKKILNIEDGKNLKNELRKVINSSKIDVCLFNILPSDWEDRFDRIELL